MLLGHLFDSIFIIRNGDLFMKVMVFTILLIHAFALQATEVKVLNELGKPLSGVMVTQVVSDPIAMDTSDGGYAKPNTPQIRDPEFSAFTNEKGIALLPDRLVEVNYRFRKYHFGHRAKAWSEPRSDRRQKTANRVGSQIQFASSIR